ncbi:MAG TPA: SEC-C domain-containing protein [Longimicrobium sp.]|nr:SEC-C domain-containing protein [Longimicrobium sp.]
MSVRRNDPCPCGSGKKYKACCQERDRARAMVAAAVGEDTLREAEAEWEAIARREPVWEAEVAPLPIGLGETPDAAQALALVTAGGFVIHGGVVAHRPQGVVERARALAEAVAAAGRMLRAFPERLRVRDEAVARALAGEVTGMGVEAGPMPELDEALAESLEHLAGHPVMGRMTTPATWAETEASAEAVAELHRAAAEFYRERAWDALGDGPLLFTFADGSAWAGSAMGGGGQEFGLALYSDPDDLTSLLEGEQDPEAHFAGMRGCSLTVGLDPRGELTAAMRREVGAARWEVAGPEAYPRIFGMRLPEWRVTAEHVERVARALRAATLASRGTDPGPETGVRVEPLEAEEPCILWPIPLEALPITAEGPGADPTAAITGWDDPETVARGEEARLRRLEDWLAVSDEVSPEEMAADAANARHWMEFLCLHAVPAGAVTEYDLRLFLYDYYPDEAEAPSEVSDALTRGMRRVFRFLEEREGIHCPFAERVLGELDDLAADAAEDGETVEAVLSHGSVHVYEDLDYRAMIYEADIPGTEDGWPTWMDDRVVALEHELTRRWLLWYDEAVRGGTTGVEELRDVLLPRQRAWENTPHPAFDGRTPVDVVRANRVPAGARS